MNYTEIVLNFVLVLHGERPATLIEYTNWSKQVGLDQFKEKLTNLTWIAGLHMTLDPLSLTGYPRYWITRYPLNPVPLTDSEIGRQLGFHCWNHVGFDDATRERFYGNISAVLDGETFHLYAEVGLVDFESSLEAKARSWQRLFDRLRWPVQFHWNCTYGPSLQTLYDSLDDKEWAIEYAQQYLDAVENFHEDADGAMEYLAETFWSLFEQACCTLEPNSEILELQEYSYVKLYQDFQRYARVMDAGLPNWYLTWSDCLRQVLPVFIVS